nr:ABC transporter permease [uncultured Shinella sp.]
MKNGPIQWIFHAAFVLFMLLPLIAVVVVSLTSSDLLSFDAWPPSLKWYEKVLQDDRYFESFRLSFLLALASATFAVALCLPASLAIARFDFPGRTAITSILQSPLMLPHVAIGVALLKFFSVSGLGTGTVGLFAAHTLLIFPFAMRLMIAGMTGYDPMVERAALSLGANRWTLFRRVTLPLVLPAVVSGWVIAFISSFDEVTMSVFIAPPGSMTLPVRIYTQLEDGIDPAIAAVSTLMLLLAVLAMIVLDYFYGLERLFVGTRGKTGH